METLIIGLELFGEKEVLEHPDLKLLVKRGSGVDNVDLEACRKHNVMVCRTPDAPANAVAELTICQMLNMLRKVQNVSDDLMKKEKWNRYIGREIKDCSVGIIGMGRIGKLVEEKLTAFEPKRILANDINVMWSDHPIESIWQCDIITIHIPLKDDYVNNTNFITMKELNKMKDDVRLLNLSRGGIINEEDLYNWLVDHPKATVALDSYCEEAYHGKLCQLGNCYLTPHMGSCTVSSKAAMKTEAEEEVQRYFDNKPLKNRII